LAALLAQPNRFAGRKVGLVLSGGNIDPMLLAEIIERGMVRSGRLARLRVDLRDVPGALAKVTALIADRQANIEEVHHQRAFSGLPVQSAEVDFVLQTRGHDHVQAVLDALTGAGFNAERHDH
jgi:threonine dehydratase